MDFTHDGDTMGYGGGNNALMGLLAGSALNKRDEDKTASTMMIVLAVIFFVIIFIIAIIALAMFNRDNKGRDHNGTDIAALLTPLIAAKSMDCNGYKNGEHDKLEIMQKLEHSEDRAEMRRVQEEQNRQTQSFMQLGFGLSGQINAHEKTDLENFAKIENQMGMMQMGIGQLLQKANNEDIIQGVINRLAYAPCYAGR